MRLDIKSLNNSKFYIKLNYFGNVLMLTNKFNVTIDSDVDYYI
jgi:hypothetical protein